MRRALGLAVASVLLVASSVFAAAPTVTLEAQGWWRLDGISVPDQVGAHVHLEATVPADGTPIDGIVAVPVTVKLHAQTGRATIVRVGQEDIVRQTWTINLGPCVDCSWSGVLYVDFSRWATGRREMRWTANVPTNDEGNRQYQSTGWQVCVRGCSPSYRSGPWIEARGWYTDHGYQNARLTSPIASVRPGGTVRIKLDHGSGGKTTRLSIAALDPRYHDGDPGRVLLTRSSAFSGSLTIPTDLEAGAHRLVLVASDGQDAGVLSIPFTAP